MELTDFPYLENTTLYSDIPSLYPTSSDIQNWVVAELNKRIINLKERSEEDLEVFRTLRSFKNRPIYVIGYRKEGKKFILEAWYFNMKPAKEYAQFTLHWVLDLVPKDVFSKKLKT